ncbi:unnamed protein product [Cunninghamella blakesleeana]
MPNPKCVDYSLYLVTDSSLIPEGTTLLEQVEKAVQGGVTVVQLREKNLDTGPFISLAKDIKTITTKYNIPLIINDRLDIAQVINADGVHIGQDDMPLKEARKILGHGKIIGVSCNNETEAKKAIEEGADYIGIGAVWFTSTKKLTKQPLDISGVQNILNSIGGEIKTVAIGGINLSNAEDLLVKSATHTAGLDGLAIVSAIIASSDPKSTCESFSSIIRKSYEKIGAAVQSSETYFLESLPEAIERIRKKTPMVHHITNNVVINDNANATLAIGASPIMSTNRIEMEELAAVNGAMLLNMGTLNDIDTMIYAAQANGRHGNPVILDPVGGGATTFRRQTVQRFIKEANLTIIKGNGAEILSLANRGGRSRGVDSVGGVDQENAKNAVKELAQKYKCIVAMTGATDYVSDGTRTVAIDNGDPLLEAITGSGCMVTSIVACYASVNRDDYLLATVAGILTVNIAAERAVLRDDVKGPGTFRSALIDEIYNISKSPLELKDKAKLRLI